MNFILAYVFPFLAAVANYHGRLALCLALGICIFGSLNETLDTTYRLAVFAVVGSGCFKLSPVIGLSFTALICFTETCYRSFALLFFSTWLTFFLAFAQAEGESFTFMFTWVSGLAWNCWAYGPRILPVYLPMSVLFAVLYRDVSIAFREVPVKYPEHQYPVWSLITKANADYHDRCFAQVSRSFEEMLRSYDRCIESWGKTIRVRRAQLLKRLESSWLARAASTLAAVPELMTRDIRRRGLWDIILYGSLNDSTARTQFVPEVPKTAKTNPKEPVEPVSPPDLLKQLRRHAPTNADGTAKQDSVISREWIEHVGWKGAMASLEDPVSHPIVPPVRRPTPSPPSPKPMSLDEYLRLKPKPFRRAPRPLPRPVQFDNNDEDEPARLPIGDSGSLASVLAPRQPSPQPSSLPPVPVRESDAVSVLPAPVQEPVTPARPTRDIPCRLPRQYDAWRDSPDPTASVDLYKPERWGHPDVGNQPVPRQVLGDKKVDFITVGMNCCSINGLYYQERVASDDDDDEPKDTEIPDAGSPEPVLVQQPVLVQPPLPVQEPLPVQGPAVIPGLGNYQPVNALVAVDPTAGVANTSSGHVEESVVVAGPDLDMDGPVEQDQPMPVTDDSSAVVANHSSNHGDIDIPDAASDSGSELTELSDGDFGEIFEDVPIYPSQGSEPPPQPVSAVVQAAPPADPTAPSFSLPPAVEADFGFSFSAPATGPSLPLTVSVPEMQPVERAPGAPPPIFTNLPSFASGWYSTTLSAAVAPSPAAASSPAASSPAASGANSPRAQDGVGQDIDPDLLDDDLDDETLDAFIAECIEEIQSVALPSPKGKGKAVAEAQAEATAEPDPEDDIEWTSPPQSFEEARAAAEANPQPQTLNPFLAPPESSAPEPAMPWTPAPGRKPPHMWGRSIAKVKKSSARVTSRPEAKRTARTQLTKEDEDEKPILKRVTLSKSGEEEETATTAGPSQSQASGSSSQASGSQAQASGSGSQAYVQESGSSPMPIQSNQVGTAFMNREWQQRYEGYREWGETHEVAVRKVKEDMA